jgi:hypothetical protein
LSRQALGFSWCSSTSFSIHSDLGAIIAEQFLEVDLSAHLVGAEKGNNVRAISFDMHLLDSCKGRCYCVTGGVGEEGEERREAGKSGDVAGRGSWAVPRRELGRARPEEGVGALCAKNSICWSLGDSR